MLALGTREHFRGRLPLWFQGRVMSPPSLPVLQAMLFPVLQTLLFQVLQTLLFQVLQTLLFLVSLEGLVPNMFQCWSRSFLLFRTCCQWLIPRWPLLTRKGL